MATSKPIIRDDSLYTIVEGPTWDQAEASAAALGGNLATINSEEENNFITTKFIYPDPAPESTGLDRNATRPGHWIGLSDRENEGVWKWSSGVTLSETGYTNWRSGDPDNSTYFDNSNGQDYVNISYPSSDWSESLIATATGKWGDLTDSERSYYGIAEIPFIRRGDSAYVIVEGPTWEEASANAQSLGGTLAIINDKEENEFITGYLGQKDIYNSAFIGFNDGKWVDGTLLSFDNFHPDIKADPSTYFEAYPYAEIWAPGVNSIKESWQIDIQPGVWNTANNQQDGRSQVGIAEIAIIHNNHAIGFQYNLLGIDEDFPGLPVPLPKEVKKQIAVLGDSVDHNARYDLNITADILSDYMIEGADITISFDAQLFNSINASDVTIGTEFPIANAVGIDNELGTIRLAAATLSQLTQNGDDISGDTVLASISLDFDESALAGIEKNTDGSLKTNPLAFSIDANLDETVFSKLLDDGSGFGNREIQTLRDLGGTISVDGQDVTLYEAKVNLAQQGDGLVLGTKRVIGSDATTTNLVRSGDTLTTSTEWLNVGNTQANNLSYVGLYNQNASLINADFSKSSIASGSFIDGVFIKDARESTVLTTDIKITGQAGNVVDLGDGIISVQADAEGSDSFSNAGKGSSNLITYQGDLNYDGRVSMKDLAYLNAGAARQELVDGTDENGNAVQVASTASYARDVDADFSGKIDIADLAVLDNDWGKTLHTGDESFQGSAEVSWSDLDAQGSYSSWENSSFKDQNSIEADAAYVGSLESPAATGVIGADGNTAANDGDMQGTEFQDPLSA